MFTGKDNGNCRYDHFTMGGGKFDAAMRCEGQAAAQEMTMAMNGTYSPDAINRSVDEHPRRAAGVDDDEDALRSQAHRRMHRGDRQDRHAGGQIMIGYVTSGATTSKRRAAFYDALMPVIGAGRIMEFGDNFTMYGTGMGKPGPRRLQALRRQFGDRRQRQYGLDRCRQPRPGRRALRQGDGAWRQVRRPARRARRGRRRRPFTAPISATSTATSWLRSGSGPPTDELSGR